MLALHVIAAAAPPAGDGAAIQDILLVGGIISAATAAVLALLVSYRRGGGSVLRAAEGAAERAFRAPAWATLPSLLVVLFALLTFMGAIWDIGIHISEGRDTGPFGTIAHYPLLLGLILVWLTGILAVGISPTRRSEASRSAVPIRGVGYVSTGALLILVGGAYGMLAFPLDDLWHRIFGQDVTLWGPTHTMFFGGLLTAAMGGIVVRVEGARVAGSNPFDRFGLMRRPVPVLCGAVLLFVATHATDEFNWGIMLYRQVWAPLLLAFFGGAGLVAARSLGGRGAALGAVALYLVVQYAEVLLIGAMGTPRPASVLFVVEALVVEGAALAVARGRGVRFGAVAGLGVGTIGFAAEYAWTHVAMPLPWTPAVFGEGIPSAALAGVAGGVLGALLAQALRGELRPGRGDLGAAIAAAATIVGLGVNAGIAHVPTNATATMVVGNERTATIDGQRTPVADVRVRVTPAALPQDANWAYVLSWQGGGIVRAKLISEGDGTYRSDRAVPISGRWKTAVRLQKGRAMAATPVYIPADAAIGYPGHPAPTREVTRPITSETHLLQTERKLDGPTWLWTPGLLLLMALNLGLMALVAVGAVRAGRPAPARDRDEDAARPAPRQREPALA